MTAVTESVPDVYRVSIRESRFKLQFNFQRTGNDLSDYRIAWIARESTPPNPMITVSSNNQTIGVILVFIRHLLIGFVCGQTDMHTVYNKQG